MALEADTTGKRLFTRPIGRKPAARVAPVASGVRTQAYAVGAFMNIGSQIFALLAAALHALIFCMESLWFMRPSVHKRFGAATIANAEAARLFAFNQGFYNLFLAIGVFVGLVLLHTGGNVIIGQTLVFFSCACMVGAAVILFLSAGRHMLRAAVVQAVFPLLAWVVYIGF